jgi:hypothetical protein
LRFKAWGWRAEDGVWRFELEHGGLKMEGMVMVMIMLKTDGGRKGTEASKLGARNF